MALYKIWIRDYWWVYPIYKDKKLSLECCWPNFNEKHKFFQEQYEQIDEFIDEIAEHAHTLNGKSLGTLAEFIEQGSIQETPGKYPDELTMISNLLADHEQIIRSLRTDANKCEKYHDMGTNNFLIGAIEKQEKMA